MAEINLQSFLEELDKLLENEAHEEVIGRCKHILKTYPKHLDTYRILGKALLEKNRHQDAQDVFQRVLSAEPRDFISHAAMSVVYEEQHQLDEAIWHMERAFEQEPNNQAVREELRRLYRQRDGFEPAQIQLTPGALASQYARGGLYAQAIAELRRALSDHPDRMDLLTLLAECLWKSGQVKDAAEVAARILEKLPNCLVANQTLGEMWLRYGRAQEAAFYLARVEALAPYRVLEIASGGAPVDREAVRIPELEWSGAAASLAAGAPDWVAAVGEAFADESEEVPDWARDLGGSTAAPLSVEEALQFNMADYARGTEETVPEWMADLRAEAQPDQEPMSPFAPDWMTETEVGPIETTLPEADSTDLDWMQGFSTDLAPEEEEKPDRVPTGLTDELEGAEQEQPDWLREFMGDAGEAAAEEEPSAVEAPDWLTGGDLGAGAALRPVEAPAEPAPDWWSESASAEAAIDEDAWLAGMMGSAETTEAPAAEVEAGAIPDWFTAPQAEAGPAEEADMEWLTGITEPAAEEAAPVGEMDMDWLTGMTEAPAAVVADEEIGADWLADMTESPAEGAAEGASRWTAGLPETPVEGVSGAESGAPRWTASLPETPAEGSSGAAPGAPRWTAGLPELPEEEPVAPGLEWMADLTAPSTTPKAGAEPAEPGVIPDWLAGAEPEAEAEPAEAAGMDWLTEAAEAPAEPGVIPDWLAGAEPEAEAEPTEAAGMDWLTEAAEAPTVAEPLSDWLGGAEPEVEAEPAEAVGMDWLTEAAEAPAEAGEVPDWLAGVAPEAEAEPAEALDADWFADIAEPSPEAEAGAQRSGLTDWLVEAGIEERVQSFEPGETPGGTGALAEVDELDWLTAFEPGYDPEAIARPKTTQILEELEEEEERAAPEVEAVEAAPAEPSDFLAELLASARAEEAPPVEAGEAEPVAEADFLAGLTASVEEEEALETPFPTVEAAEAEPAEATDFLAELLGASAVEEAETPEAPLFGEELEIGEEITPRWMAAVPEAPGELDISITPRWLAQTAEPEVQLDTEVIPRWLRAPTEETPMRPAWMAQPPEPEPPAEPVVFEELAAEFQPSVEAPAEVPGWPFEAEELEAEPVDTAVEAPGFEAPEMQAPAPEVEEAAPAVAPTSVEAALELETPVALDTAALEALMAVEEPAVALRLPKARFAFEWLEGPPPRAGFDGAAPTLSQAAFIAEPAFSEEDTTPSQPTESMRSIGAEEVTDVNFGVSADLQHAEPGDQDEVGPVDVPAAWLREPTRETGPLSEHRAHAGRQVAAPEWLRETREEAEDWDAPPEEDPPEQL